MAKTRGAFDLIERYGPNCWICGLCCDFRTSPKKAEKKPHYRRIVATTDHVVPRSKGGSNYPENLRVAHGYCNSKRGSEDMNAAFGKKCREWILYNIPHHILREAEGWILLEMNRRRRNPMFELSQRLPQPEPDWWATQPQSPHWQDAMYRVIQGGLCNGK